MSLADVTSARSSPTPEACPECDTSASVTSDLHKYQVACTCKPSSPQYACADEPGPPVVKSGDIPPALPPRPSAALAGTNRRNNAALPNAAGAPVADGVLTCARRRKYAWWCVGCGALAAALGGLLAAAHILLRAYTASPHHLETVPAAVPAAMLVLTGVCIMSLARRRNRYSYMIKVVGACCLVCALTCVLVTITTTVIHMNKLQTLKFCEYTKLTRTCTCFSLPPDSHHSSEEDEGVRCVFEGVTDCGVVHGVLYWCLRGVFALSVTAVLVCIFSSMLAYQLLSHERKKMYWEQLELRCRSLYRPPSGVQPRARPMQPPCGCCQQCHPAQPAWDISLQHRFWAPGRIGNLYSPNPGTVRKTSAWSWFPWPRSNSQRCRMGAVPQSGDSAYGFCDTSGENPTQTSSNPNPTTPYEDRPSYPSGFNQNNPTFNQNSLQFASSAFDGAMSQSTANFGQNSGTFGQSSAGFVQSAAGFGQSAAGYEQEGQFGEGNGSFDVQNGVWGPPPPYSPQGRGGSRHHLHQDPAATTLLHHHHVEMHRNSMPVHNHAHTMGSSMAIQHTCSTGRNSSYMGHLIHPNAAITADISQMAPELVRLNPELARFNPELARMNPELSRLNPELARLNPELARLNPELARLNPELVRLNPEMARFNQELHSEMGFGSEMVRLGSEMSRLASDGRCNTLRGHLVPYNGCQRMMGVSMGNLHRECGSEGMPMECLHQKNSNDQNVDSASKQGKENLAFQNDKHSPVRSSLQLECRGNPHTESEVYFADVSSCCNISVKADCCVSSNVSALVGTIENHPESTSGESDNGSFTLTRQQRPQPQTLGSKRRQRLPPSNEKARVNELNNSIRSLGQSERCQNERRQNCHDLNNSIRSMGQNDQRNGQSDISFRSIGQCDLRNAQNDRTLDDLNASVRSGHIDLNNSMRHELNSLRQSEHSSPIRMCSQNDHGSPMHSVHHERRMSDQNSNSSLMEDSRSRGSPKFKPNLSGLRARHDRSQNESFEQRISQNDSRISQIEPRIGQIDSRISQCDPRMGQCDPRIGQCDPRMAQSDPRIGQCDLRINHCDTRIGQCDPKIGQCDQRVDQNDQHIGQCDPRIGQSDPRIGQCDQRIGQSNPRMVQSDARFDHRSPKCDSPLHPRQSSSDSTASHKNPEFFVPPPPSHSPLSPATEESLISDEELERSAEVFKKTEKVLLGPDSQYDQREEIKPNHHHCYSDTNTMDSGWQSGSEKHVTD